MKNFLKLSFLGLVTLFMITSCETDPIDTGGGGVDPTDVGPTLVLSQDAGYLSEDSFVSPGEIFTVRLIATKGSSVLNSLTFNENGARITDFANRISIDGTPAAAAALIITGTGVDGFSADVEIRAQEDRSKSLYQFVVVDANGNSAATDIEISTELPNSGVIEPVLTLKGNPNVISDPGSLVCFNLEALPSDLGLSAIVVVDESGPIDPTRLYFGGTDATAQLTDNPYLLDVADQGGFEKQLYIRAQNDQSEQDYFIAVGDSADSTAIVSVTINTYPDGISGQAVTELTGVLFNRAGPSGTGGLDLDSGASTGSSDIAAELKDNGIDGSNLDVNWLQRISGNNGTELKALIPNQGGLGENFTFASVTVDAQIKDIWGNGIDFTGTNPNNGEAWSEFVTVGDMFIALRDGKYYMMEVTKVFIDPVSNGDFYEMSIKF